MTSGRISHNMCMIIDAMFAIKGPVVYARISTYSHYLPPPASSSRLDGKSVGNVSSQGDLWPLTRDP